MVLSRASSRKWSSSRPNRHTRLRRNGFTIFEVLLYTAFVAMILSSVTILVSAALSSQSKLRSSLILKTNVRYALLQIQSAVGEAKSITTPASGVTSSTIVLTTASSTQTSFTFPAASGTLMMAQGTSTALQLLSNEVQITNFAVTRLSSASSTLSISLSAKLRGASASYPTVSVTTTAAIRR